jgi:ABC-type sugar transport system substrate-binding protein
LSLLCLTLQGNEPFAADDRFRIALFTGSDENNPFWKLFTDFMSEVAADLDIEVEYYYADGNRKRIESQVLDVCRRADRPDAIVIQDFRLNGVKILNLANEKQMPVFLVNSGLEPNEKQKVGAPRKELQYWIGEMLPEEHDAGLQLANALIDEAKKDPQHVDADGRVHVIALTGEIRHVAASERVRGLQDAIASRPNDDAILHQVVEADWDRGLARSRCRILHRRYPDATVIWTASDYMAMGAIDAVRDRGLVPGRDVIVGGVDATREAIRLIEEGTMHATVGGHFMEGGWVTVLLHDYLHGVDPDRIPPQHRSPMELVTKENLARYRMLLQQSNWKRTDFRQLSLLRSPERNGYRFGPQVIWTEDQNRER